MRTVLVVDDEKLIRWSISEGLKAAGFATITAADGHGALEHLDESAFDAVVLDMRLPDMDGMVVLRTFQAHKPDVPVVVVTAFSSVDGAVEALKAGAGDYVTKPFQVQDLVERVSGLLDGESPGRAGPNRAGLDSLVGESDAIRRVRKQALQAVRSGARVVLLTGETGTGKDLLARLMHYESERSAQPFLVQPCGVLPPDLLEGDLFGSDGGPCGARQGLFELARCGTVYLDEVTGLPPRVQSGLLRIFGEGAVDVPGSDRRYELHCRVTLSTRYSLESAIRAGILNEELGYRVSILSIAVPPLRERPEDLVPLARHILGRAGLLAESEPRISEPAMKALRNYEWPGNVRELQDTLVAAARSGEGVVRPEHLRLGRSVVHQRDGGAFSVRLPADGCRMEDVEKELLRQALRRTGGNQSRAARLLGVSRDQMRYKVRKFGIRM